MGPGDEVVPSLEQLAVHAELIEIQQDGFLVEDAQHDTLAEEHGDDGDAEVVFGTSVAECDAAILWFALLGDVEIRHDFEAADDGIPESVDGGWDAGGAEDAVDAIADGEGVFVGFDVDVGCAFADSFQQQVIDELDDACFLGLFDFTLGGCVEVAGICWGFLVGHCVERVAGDAVVGADELAEVLFVCEDQLDGHSGEEA